MDEDDLLSHESEDRSQKSAKFKPKIIKLNKRSIMKRSPEVVSLSAENNIAKNRSKLKEALQARQKLVMKTRSRIYPIKHEVLTAPKCVVEKPVEIQKLPVVKKERKPLTLDLKVEIIKDKEAGLQTRDISEKYNVSKQCISMVFRNRAKILDAVLECQKLGIKRRKYVSGRGTSIFKRLSK
jgi:CENP-B N-terminal DNA-binding domain